MKTFFVPGGWACALGRKLLPIICAAVSAASLPGAEPTSKSLGVFTAAADIGSPAKGGSVRFSAGSATYEVAGGGENMWFTNDSFHFVHTRMEGGFSLSANIRWPAQGGNPHRKACLLVRQSLAPDAAYIDVAVHGDGLTSLQFRETAGGPTREIQFREKNPTRVGIERHGSTFVAMIAEPGGKLRRAGAFKRIDLGNAVYLGLGVCAHDDGALEKAEFSDVLIRASSAGEASRTALHCALEIVPIASRDRRVVYYTTNHIEAPNWGPDARTLIFNSRGQLYRIAVEGGTPSPIDTGFAIRCNNDHGISPDRKMLVISDQTRTGQSLIYTLPIEGGTPRPVTELGPSYWHGWSPDGRTLVYCAERQGEYDVYAIPAVGGKEQRLTTARGLDDGPEYSPDGKHIYFNSDRTGRMQIWRMRPDGSGQEQVTHDEFNNWFAHPSPDGKWLVFLSYEPEVKGHPANQPVRLRLMPAAGGAIQDLASLFGGQGTINVPSWSPDSRQVAFVSYELLPP